MYEPAPATRGAQFVAYVEKLRAWGELDRVLARMAPETRLLVERPPVAWEWVPLQHNIDLFVAVDIVLGLERVRALAHDAARDAFGIHLRPVLEVTLAAFGASPRTLLAHAETLLRFRIRGQRLAYKGGGTKSGVVEIRLHGLVAPAPFFEAWAGIAEHGVELCGTRGTVAVARMAAHGEDQIAVLDVAWE